MKLKEAIDVILDLATQNISSDPEEAERQETALTVVEDFFFSYVDEVEDEN